MTTKTKCPTYSIFQGEWTEPMTTDVMVDLFAFGEMDEAELDRVLYHLDVGQELELKCSSFADDENWTQLVRRES